jgi:hypothetical protein
MLTQPYTFISGRITLFDSSPDQTSTYPALHGLTQPNYLTRLLSRSDFYSRSLTRSYPAELPYPILPPIGLLPTKSYPATLPDFLTWRVTLRSTRLLTHPYLVTLSSRAPFNWPHPKTSSSASHLDIGLLLADNASR